MRHYRREAGAVLIHTPESAGYSFAVVQSSWSGEGFSLPRAAGEPALALKAWISQAGAEKTLALAGQNLPALQQALALPELAPYASVPYNFPAREEIARLLEPVD